MSDTVGAGDGRVVKMKCHVCGHMVNIDHKGRMVLHGTKKERLACGGSFVRPKKKCPTCRGFGFVAPYLDESSDIPNRRFDCPRCGGDRFILIEKHEE